MTKPMGIICVVIGGLLVAAGIYLLSVPSKKHESIVPQQNNSSATEDNIVNIESHAENTLKNMAKMAAADGVLTEQEIEEIAQYAQRSGLEPQKYVKMAEDLVAASGKKPEVEKIDYNIKNGLDFEKFVVDKFSKNYFTIIKWTGDKISDDGRHDGASAQPDLVMEFALKNVKDRFAVECKWRSHLYKGGFDIGEQSWNKYNDFQQKTGMPVFIAVGLGGSGNNPDKLFIVPLRAWESGFITLKDCGRYKKDKTKNFFYDQNKKALK